MKFTGKSLLLKDLHPSNIGIICKNSEEFEKVSEFIKPRSGFMSSSPCLFTDGTHSSVEYAESGYECITAKEFINANTIKYEELY